MTPGDRVRHVDGWTGKVRLLSLAYLGFEENRVLVHRDDTQRSEWVRVEDLEPCDNK